MRPAGATEVDRAKADGRWDAAYEGQRTSAVPDDLQRELDARPAAQAFFAGLSSQNRYAILYRLQDAKRPETRARRWRSSSPCSRPARRSTPSSPQLRRVGRDDGPGRRLDDPDVVAERVAQRAVRAVEVLGRLIGELDALRAQLLVGLAAVVGREAGEAVAPFVTRSRPGRRRVVHRRRPGFSRRSAVPLPRDADGQPAHEAHVDVGVDLEAELADVEVEGLVLVEDVDG